MKIFIYILALALLAVFLVEIKTINERIDQLEQKLTPPTYKYLDDYPDPYKNEVDKEKLKIIERDRILEDQIQQSS